MIKKITIEKLAEMIQRGFRSTQSDIHGLKSDVSELKSDIKGVKQSIVNLESDVAYLKARVMEIGITLEKHEDILNEHSTELKWIHKKIDEFADPKSDKRFITYEEFSRLVSRVDYLEKKVKAKIS